MVLAILFSFWCVKSANSIPVKLKTKSYLCKHMYTNPDQLNLLEATYDVKIHNAHIKK